MPLALFDLDNTLLDRARGFRSWARSFLRSAGISVPGAIDWFVDADHDGRTPRDDLFALAAARFGLADDPAALVERYRREHPAHVRLEDDVATALRVLRASGWRIGIVTNGSEAQARKIIGTGLADLVDGWAVSEVEGVRKPAPALFAIAAARAGHPLDSPEAVADAWMVGDDPVADVGGGHDLGCTTVWVHRERTWELTAYHPSFLVTSMPEAVTLMLGPEFHLPAAFA